MIVYYVDLLEYSDKPDPKVGARYVMVKDGKIQLFVSNTEGRLYLKSIYGKHGEEHKPEEGMEYLKNLKYEFNGSRARASDVMIKEVTSLVELTKGMFKAG